MGHGGYRPGAGRKPKCQEQKLIEKLTPLEDKAHTHFKQAIERGEKWAIKMFFEYMYGRPRIQQNVLILNNERTLEEQSVLIEEAVSEVRRRIEETGNVIDKESIIEQVCLEKELNPKAVKSILN